MALVSSTYVTLCGKNNSLDSRRYSPTGDACRRHGLSAFRTCGRWFLRNSSFYIRFFRCRWLWQVKSSWRLINGGLQKKKILKPFIFCSSIYCFGSSLVTRATSSSSGYKPHCLSLSPNLFCEAYSLLVRPHIGGGIRGPTKRGPSF